METQLFIYILKVNISLAILYLLYAVMFRKDTFIGLRRGFFLTAITFSLLYPLFTVNALSDVFTFEPATNGTYATVMFEEPTAAVVVDNDAAQTAILWQKLLMWSIAGGTIFFALRFAWQLLSVLRVKRRCKSRQVSGTTVYHLPAEIMPFSFFGWIFINAETHSEEELKQIILHEQTHARQWHSVDILLAEMLCIFFWWNPVVWLMKREMAMNLEYLADYGVLRQGVNSREYQYHLLRLTYHETAVQIVNNFNVSQLKQRIMMMNKTKSPVQKLAKYVLIFPLMFLLITINSCTNKEKSTNDDDTTVVQTADPVDETPVAPVDTGEVYVVVEDQPTFPGGNAAMIKFLNETIKYPVEAQEKDIQGRVITNFIVEKDGRITDVQVVRSIDPLLDKEAVRVIQSMPNWEPGAQRGENVRVRFTLPVVFRLQGDGNKASGTPPPPPHPTDASGTPPPPPPPPPSYTKSEEELKNTNEVFVVVETQPEFPQGNAALMRFLSDNIEYPKEAQENGIQGRVITNFVVEKDGSISDVQVVRAVNTLLDAEAVRVIKTMPNWKPGTLKGQPVRTRFTLPVVFRLQP